MPPGVLNVVTGAGSTVGQALVEHPGIDKIAFTGDTTHRQGRSCASAAETLKTITLELGGKSPNIVLRGRRHRRGASAARRSASSTARARSAPPARGCWSIASIKDEFIDKLAARDEEDGAGRSAGSEDALRLGVVEEAAGDGAALHRVGEAGRRDARRRRRARRHRHGQGLLRAADGVCRRARRR